MEHRIRFGDFVKEVSIKQHRVSYKDLFPKAQKKPHKPQKIQLRSMDIYRLLKPYVSTRFMDQVKSVVPLALYLMLFQMFILRQGVQDATIITGGLVAVILGLMLFMEGLKLGLMPFGETIGTSLPTKSPLWMVLLIAFLLGIGVTFAEPAIGALKAAGSIVNVEAAPYLYTLLNEWSGTLVMVVGIGVGLAAVLGTMRFIYGWSLKPMVYMALIPTLAITAYIYTQPHLASMLGLAWDCGAVTTGPVTVPLVLSLGIGVAASAGKGSSSLSGFGIVTLASIFPIIAVLLLALYVSTQVSPEEIIAAAQSAGASASTASANWWEVTPGQEIVLGLRAIVPLVIFLFFVLKVILRERISHPLLMTYGITLTVLGMIIFNLGLTYGLAKLGGQSGGLVPGAFTQIEAVAESPLYMYAIGFFIAVGFAWFLGFGATLAEPALNALGLTVQNLTNGAFKKSLLMYSVSIGVGTGIALGVLKIVFDIPITFLLIPGYFLAIVLTKLSSEEFVNVAWDSAGVTTGPVTVPLVLAMGLGFGNALSAVEGFGILSMASICPILSVLICGLYINWRVKNKRNAPEPNSNQPELEVPSA